LKQKAQGIHTRIYSRSYFIEDSKKYVLFINADIHACSQGLREEVIKELNNRFNGVRKFSTDNVVITATHTHR
jgi:neutral ceramidase